MGLIEGVYFGVKHGWFLMTVTVESLTQVRQECAVCFVLLGTLMCEFCCPKGVWDALFCSGGDPVPHLPPGVPADRPGGQLLCEGHLRDPQQL